MNSVGKIEEIDFILDIIDKKENKAMRGFLRNAQVVYYSFMLQSKQDTFKSYIVNTTNAFRKAFKLDEKEAYWLVLGILYQNLDKLTTKGRC